MCSPEQGYYQSLTHYLDVKCHVKRTRLPKQWKHWAKKAGLKPSGKSGREYWDKFYLTGKDRYWWVNDKGDFECSCPIEYFDRRANIRGVFWVGIPACEKEFLGAVYCMHKDSENMS